jgi:phosphoribosylformylglycinamidine (FGAM) synthase-like enzyme
LSRGRTRADIVLFNESQSRIVMTFAPRHASEILDFLKSRSIPHTRLGEVTQAPTLTIEATGKTFAWPLEKLRTPFEKTISSLMSWAKYAR